LLGKTPKLINKVKSQIDYIDDIKIKDDGTIVHNVFRNYTVTKGKNKSLQNDKGPKTWPSIETFKSWRMRHLAERREHIKDQLTPLQFYVT